MIIQLLVFCEEDFNKTLAGKIRKYNWTERKHILFKLYGNNCAEHFFQLHSELADHIQL